MACQCCDPSRRRVLRGTAAAGAAAAIWSWPGRAAWAAMDTAGPGTLRQVMGEVRINGMEAVAGAVVKPGDRVSTGSDAQAVFTLGDDGFLLRAKGEVSVVDRGRDAATGKPVREMLLETGRVLSVFGPKHITLKTPYATVGIRGTAAYMESDGRSMNVCVCYGHAVMEPLGAPGRAEEVRNRHHETPRLIQPGPNGMTMEPYAVKNHTDEELVMLESLFGRVPPFR